MGESMDLAEAEMRTPAATPATKKKRRSPKVPSPAKKERRTPKGRFAEMKNTVDVWAVQCKECLKWRVIPTQEEYEHIRKNSTKEPFTCNRKPNVSCHDQSDLDYGNNQIWVMDRPNIPQTPAGFKRDLVLRKDLSKMDCYYVTPDGRKLRALTEVATFLRGHPEYKDLSVVDFSFSTPKIAAETIPQNLAGKKERGDEQV